MLRLAKYLKPFALMIILSIGLLYAQAMADLALPKYMSRIVNNGIQQGGVENAVPDAIRESQMLRLTALMSTENQARVLAAYTYVDAKSPDYAAYVKDYPVLADEPIYVRNQLDKTETEALNPILGRAWLGVAGLQQMLADPAKAAAFAAQTGMDLSKLPPGTDLFAMLAKLPEAQRAKLTSAMDETFASLGDSMVVQSAVGQVKAEYAALGVDTAKMQSNYILRTGFSMLLLSLAGAACTIAVGFLSARTGAGLARNLRRLVFTKVESFSGAEFDKFSTASLITRSTNDVTQIQMLVIMMLRMIIYAPIMGVGGTVRAMETAPSMWWLIAAGVGILLVMIAVVFSIALPRFKIIQSLIDRLNLVVRENLSGMMVIRSFNRQPFEETRFDRANRELTDTNLFINRVMVFMMPMMMLLMNGLSVMIIWIGAHQVAQASIQVGDMMAFLQYAMQVVFSFLMISMMFIFIPRAAVSGARIADVLETEISINDPAEPKRFNTPVQGVVEFRDVSFRYPGAEENVLCGINFTARPGQTTAVIGSTGSGKSTIVRLIPRFFDVTDGAILLDGVDIREVTQHDLRAKIGYIPQTSTLFSGTIESNLRYADENATEAELMAAADIAQADEFIDDKPEGLDTPIAQGGTNVSGGQRQRLSIARALVKKAPIYIFDDSFSALDFRTDAALRRALREKTAASTLIIVTQRISTIKNAEQIVVLDDGQVAGIGTHADLMQTCETYREIALSQLSQEELA